MVGQAAAGHTYLGNLGAGEAVRIFTGASIPAGADLLVIQELCRIDGSDALIPDMLQTVTNFRRMGEDMVANTEILPAHHRIRMQDLPIIAALGHGEATVFLSAPAYRVVFHRR